MTGLLVAIAAPAALLAVNALTAVVLVPFADQVLGVAPKGDARLAVLFTCWGVTGAIAVINGSTYRQRVCPDDLQSRVNTTARMVAWGLGQPLGAAPAGVVGAWRVHRHKLIRCRPRRGG